MHITKEGHDSVTGTDYFTVSSISNWDLEKVWRLLEAEKARSNCVDGFYRGSEDLLTELRKLAKKMEWKLRRKT